MDVQPYTPSIIYRRVNALVIAVLLSRVCEPPETAGSCTEGMEVVPIFARAGTALDKFSTVLSLKDLQSVNEAVMLGWSKETPTTEGMKLF